ncbi:MAG: hypothetical protein GX660_05495 [Clostridiaceae bacterium]|nr:hypothetical protein [Clostridiaceae bacterium]
MKGKFHQYSADTNDRRLIHVYFTIASVLFAYLLNWITQNTSLKIPWWLDAPAIFGFYGLIYLLFNNVLWKMRVIRLLFQIKTPDWNGDYKCVLRTSFDNFQSEKDLTIKITQNWDSILIQIKTNSSVSNSLSGSFSINDSSSPQFTYEYINKPNNDAPFSMNIHYGMANIWIDSGLLKGEFFNGRGRNNYGTFQEIK